MSALRELQLAVSAAVLDGAPAPPGIVSNGLAPERRLRIYRNNTRENLLQALRSAYPAVERLVGEGFFGTAARLYLASHPSRSGDLNRYGEGYADFLARYEHARGLPYLPDLARLEWALHEAYYAEDAPVLGALELAGVDAGQAGALCFTLHPSSRLLHSPYPLGAIWALDADQPGEVALDAGDWQALVLRVGLEVQLVELAKPEHAWLLALRGGAALQEALAAALSLDADFDLQAAWLRHLGLGTFTAFTVAAGSGADRQFLP